MYRNVFVNRILNLKKIKLIGVDMDHTLIRYKTREFETLVYQILIDKLISDAKYPENIKNLQFFFDDAIRGLIIDSKNGNILKLSRYGAIRHSYHGTQLIDFHDQNKIYRSIYVDLKDPNYIAIDTSFSIAFCVLYGQLVDFKDLNPHLFPSYADIARDVLHYVDLCHADGSLKRQIASDLNKYVIVDPQIVEGIKKFIRYGKKFFVLTNSDFHYTKLLLDFSLNPFLEADQSWTQLFEFVITLANKPRFFYDNLKFLSVNPENGTMVNLNGMIVPGIYQGGAAKKFTDDLGLKGDEILYIGDHIYGDILRLKKDCNWRTALVVEELGSEIQSQQKAVSTEQQIAAAMISKSQMESEYNALYTDVLENRLDQENSHLKLDEVQKQLAIIDSKISNLIKKQGEFYNPHWGRVFRAGAEESYFAYQVDRFACIYMEKLTDLLSHSPLTYFRANRRLLPHDH